MTTPLAPASAPVLIRKSSNSAWVKWYPGNGGAFRFVVQIKIETSPSSSASANGNTNISNNKTSNASNNWVNVFNGQETTWKSTTLVPDTSYAVRVYALNCQGISSEPSAILKFKTLPREEGKEFLTPRNAGSTFLIECTGDICVGDTILITGKYTHISSCSIFL